MTRQHGAIIRAFISVVLFDVEMSTAVEAGFAVTSHDVSRITTAAFDHPER